MTFNFQRDQDIIDWLVQEYQQPFEGWDFSRLANRRVHQDSLPWDYASIVRAHLRSANSLLDIGTGGGEVLANILGESQFSGEVRATEAYEPNVAIARTRLAPFGVTVQDITSNPATFRNASFDLVVDRHSGTYRPRELMDMVTPDGRYITEQVGEQTNVELRRLFRVEPRKWPGQPHNGDEAFDSFTGVGFIVERIEEYIYPVRFMDAGALVYYLKAVPHEVPGFSIDKYAAQLIDMVRETPAKGYAINSSFHAYLVVAHKPG